MQIETGLKSNNMTEIIPTFDFYKTIESDISFEYQRLETSYRDYDSSHPHRHNCYEIVFFERSGGEHHIDFKRYDITENTIHIVCPEQVHLLKRNKDVTGYVLSFSAELFLSIVQNSQFLDAFPFLVPLNSAPIVKLELDQIPQLMSLIKQLEQEYFSSQKDKKDMLAILCLQLLQFLKRQFPQTENTANEQYLPSRFKKMVEREYLKINTVSEYADLLAVSAGHLNDIVKKATGKSAKMIISEHITLEAKRLLYHSQLSIKEIASNLNFEESSYFIRFFRKQTGLTPIAFRNNIREKYH